MELQSDISGLALSDNEVASATNIRQSLFEYISTNNPNFSRSSHLSKEELNQFREDYISSFLVNEIGELGALEKNVLKSLTHEEHLINRKVTAEENQSFTFGQKIADNVASFGGSWTFIISFGVFIIIWISGNVMLLRASAFDPYPFILLNLILSCLAALQAPVIMMSQNRQEEKDRTRARNDYMVNLKSELEIRMLHEKIDHMIIHQQKELLEIQKIQIEMMNDIINMKK